MNTLFGWKMEEGRLTRYYMLDASFYDGRGTTAEFILREIEGLGGGTMEEDRMLDN